MKPTAYVILRDSPHYRRDAVVEGLARLGYGISFITPVAAGPGDVLVMWNRYGVGHRAALTFENAGRPVFVMENGYLGVDWRKGRWYALARSWHNGPGNFNPGGPERWDRIGVEPGYWAADGRGVLALAQRGIGTPPVASPRDWLDRLPRRLANSKRQAALHIRHHPGQNADWGIPLAEDLRRGSIVWTWASGAALKAILYGWPALYDLPGWIGAGAAVKADDWLSGSAEPKRDDAARLAMFRRLAWAMWDVEELRTGEPFRRLGA